MAIRTLALTTLMALGLAACEGIETSSRDIPLESPLLGGGAIVAEQTDTLKDARLTVSQDLSMSGL